MLKDPIPRRVEIPFWTCLSISVLFLLESESGVPSSTKMEYLVIAALGIVILFLRWRSYHSRGTPPGPFCWPLVGCIFSLKQPLQSTFADLSKKYGPIMHFKLGMLPLVVVNSSETAKELLKKHDVEFANRPPTRFLETYSQGFKDMMFAPYGEHFSAMRRAALAGMFSTAKINASSFIRESELRSVVSAVKNSKVVQLRDELGEFNSNIMFRLLFGVKPASSMKALLEVVEEMNRGALNVNIGELFPTLDWLDLHGVYKKMRTQLVPQMTSIIEKVIQERTDERNRRQAPKDEREDFADLLLELRDKGSISTTTVFSVLMDMIVAGIETSQGVAEFAMAEVMNNPKVMETAQHEIDQVVGPTRLVQESDVEKLLYVQAIVKETLRLHPPAPLGIPHYNPKESTLAGYRIPAKTQVLVNIWAIGRDPANWTDPKIFKPERFLGSDVNVTGQHFELLPFSSGRRICAGYPLAVRSLPMVVATLLHAFDWKRIGTNSLEEAFGTLSCKLASKVEACATPRLEEAAYIFST